MADPDNIGSKSIEDVVSAAEDAGFEIEFQDEAVDEQATDPDGGVGEDREKIEGAAFWRVEGEYGTVRVPIDGRAVYGHLSLGGRDEDDISVPVREGVSNVVTAIRTLSRRHSPLGDTPDDSVRVNDGGWMVVTGSDDEGFIARYVNGDVEYAIWPTNPSDNPPGTFDHAWMRRVDDWSSAGGVDCIEVDWDT